MFNNMEEKSDRYFSEYQHFKNTGLFGNKFLRLSVSQFLISQACQLLYYPAKKVADKKIFLIVPSIFNSPEILFINHEKNFIDHLQEEGEIYLINWLEEVNSEHSFDDYVHEVNRVISLLEAKNKERINLIGHCIGGNLAIAALVSSPNNAVRTLTLLTTPWDFFHFAQLFTMLQYSQVEQHIKKYSYVPAIYIQILFFLLEPTSYITKIQKYLSFTSEEEKVVFLAVEDWLMSANSLSKATYFQLINEIIRQNLSGKNKWVINQHIIDPAHLQLPVMLISAQKDQLVPINSILPLHNRLKNSRILEVSGGHINYLISHTLKNFFTNYSLWIGEHA